MKDVTTAILRYADRAEAEKELRDSLSEVAIPEHLHSGLVRYLLDGIRPGGFLTAVLKNDLKDATLRGDNSCTLYPLVLWLTNCVPAPCWGSPQEVEQWITRKAVGGVE